MRDRQLQIVQTAHRGPANLGPDIDSDRAMPLDLIIQFKVYGWFNHVSEVLKFFKKIFQKTHNPN